MKTRQEIERKIKETAEDAKEYPVNSHLAKSFDVGFCSALNWVLSVEYGMSEKLDLEEINKRNIHKVIVE